MGARDDFPPPPSADSLDLSYGAVIAHFFNEALDFALFSVPLVPLRLPLLDVKLNRGLRLTSEDPAWANATMWPLPLGCFGQALRRISRRPPALYISSDAIGLPYGLRRIMRAKHRGAMRS